MQDFFTVLAESIIFCFTLVMLIDFFGGLFNLFATIPSNYQPELENQFELQLKIDADYCSNVELDSQLESISKLDFVSDFHQLELQSLSQVNSHLDSLDESPQRIPPLLNQSQLKIYKLRGVSVVRVEDIGVNVPTSLKRYKLHKRDVVKLKDLETLLN